MPITPIFLMTGAAHAPYLAVALNTLRTWWDGPIRVYAWEDSFDFVRQICCDPRIDAECLWRVPRYRGKNEQEIDKIDIIRHLGPEVGTVIYLDADLIFAGPITALADMAEKSNTGFVGVQFCDWKMNSIARGRVYRLSGIEGIDPHCVEAALNPDCVSFNTGVFACWDSPCCKQVLNTWYDWTYASRKIFISGETALHAVAQKYRISVALGGIFNCSPSPKYQPKDLRDSEVHIWHGHGDTFTRPAKCPRGVSMWWPKFQQVMDLNLGNIQDWIGQIKHKYLPDLRRQVASGELVLHEAA